MKRKKIIDRKKRKEKNYKIFSKKAMTLENINIKLSLNGKKVCNLCIYIRVTLMLPFLNLIHCFFKTVKIFVCKIRQLEIINDVIVSRQAVIYDKSMTCAV